MKDAARIAYMFHIDPIDVLRATREEWAMRIAAINIIHRDEEERARKRKGG